MIVLCAGYDFQRDDHWISPQGGWGGQPASEKSPFSEGNLLGTIQSASMAQSLFKSRPKLTTNGLAYITFAH